MSSKWNGTVHHSVGEAKTFTMERDKDGTFVFIHGCCACGSIHHMTVDTEHETITTDDMTKGEKDAIRVKAWAKDPSLFPLFHAERDIAHLRSWIADLQSGMYVNCVYCGHRYGPGETAPVSMADALKAHIEVCPQHPMSALKAALERVRALWPHIETRDYSTQWGTKDPGPPTCLRCKIEEVIR